MQFSLKRLFILTAIVAGMFGWVGQYWPVGTAVAVVVSVATGTVLLAFGTVKSWKLVAWTCAVFLGSLISIRYALDFARYWNKLDTCSNWTIEAYALLAGAVVSGALAALVLALLPRNPTMRRPLRSALPMNVCHDHRGADPAAKRPDRRQRRT